MPPTAGNSMRCLQKNLSLRALQPSLCPRCIHTTVRPHIKLPTVLQLTLHSTQPPSSRAPLHTSPTTHALRTTLRPSSKKPPANHDRGPVSQEPNQTDFTELNVLGNTTVPATSVDVCIYDGFALDSGLKITEGDGVILVGAEAFVWRPWMATSPDEAIVSGTELRRMGGNGTGGVLNGKGQWDIPEEAWGVLKAVWPKPDLLIIGTGAHIRPLAPKTRTYLQELGVRVEVLDTRNAASQFNLLATERGVTEVAAALVPIGFADR